MQSGELPAKPSEPPLLAELRALNRRAKQGDASALPRLREILTEHPAIWRHAADLEKVVVREWSELLAGDDPLSREALRLKAEELRAQLEGEQPTPLEQLLVGQVVALHLELAHAQLKTTAGSTPGQATTNLKRAESAQRRYLQAIKTLTTVRALLPAGLLPLQRLRPFDPEQQRA